MIATAGNTAVATIDDVVGPSGVAITPDGTRVYVANYWDNSVSVIATATNTVSAAVPVGTEPVAFGQFIRPPIPSAPPPLTVTSLTADQASPRPAGTLITFTATASNGVAPYQYQWWVYNGTTWSVGQAWSPSNTFAWTPTAPGSYILQAWVRSNGSTADAPEAYRQATYTITAPPPLAVTNLAPDKASPQALGTSITFTATATNGVAPYQYKWWLFNGTTWSIGQAWTTSNTFAWTPTAPGSYTLQVWARNAGTTTDTPEAYRQLASAYTVTGTALSGHQPHGRQGLPPTGRGTHHLHRHRHGWRRAVPV